MQIFQLLRSGIYAEGEAGSPLSMGYAVEGRARGKVRLAMANYYL